MLHLIEIDEERTKSNADNIANTYYEYHGEYAEGDTPATTSDIIAMKGVVVA